MSIGGNIGGIGPPPQQISSQETDKVEDVQQKRVEAFDEHDEYKEAGESDKQAEIKKAAEQTEKLNDATLKPAEVVEEMDYKAAETLETAVVKSIGPVEAPSKIEAAPTITLEGAGAEGRVTIERAAGEDGGPKTEDREAIIDSNDGTSREVIIDSNDGTSLVAEDGGPKTKDREAVAETAPEVALEVGAETIIDSNDGISAEEIIDSNDSSSAVGIIDSNDGISAEAIIDSNDANLIKGDENRVMAEPPTWSDQMNQGGVDDAGLHASDGLADPDEIDLQMPDSKPGSEEIGLQMPDSKPMSEDISVAGLTSSEVFSRFSDQLPEGAETFSSQAAEEMVNAALSGDSDDFLSPARVAIQGQFDNISADQADGLLAVSLLKAAQSMENSGGRSPDQSPDPGIGSGIIPNYPGTDPAGSADQSTGRISSATTQDIRLKELEKAQDAAKQQADVFKSGADSAKEFHQMALKLLKEVEERRQQNTDAMSGI